MNITDIPAAQDMLWCMGSYGCYFLCLCEVAERIAKKEIDVLREAYWAITNNVLGYRFTSPKAYGDSMYVKDADKILKHLIGKSYYIRKVSSLPDGYTGYYIIKWAYGNITHFVLPGYDNLTYSNTVAKGKISQYYLVECNS